MAGLNAVAFDIEMCPNCVYRFALEYNDEEKD